MFRPLFHKDYVSFALMFDHVHDSVLSKDNFYNFVRKLNRNHQVWVKIDVEDRVIASATVLFETKLHPNESEVAYIHDISVSKSYDGKGIEMELCRFVLDYAKQRGCAKTFLDCDIEKIPFLSGARLNEKTSQYIFKY